MIPATLVPDLAMGFAEKMSSAIETGKVETLSVHEVSDAIVICNFLQNLFRMAHSSIEKSLHQGVDAKVFVNKYERVVVELDTIVKDMKRVVAKVRATHLPELAEAFVSDYQELGTNISNLRLFLVEALAKAKTPVHLIDRKKIQEAEGAFQRGETKPFQRSSTTLATE